MPPTAPPEITRNVLPSQLTRTQQHYYAHALAQALHNQAWTNPSHRTRLGETQDFHVWGAHTRALPDLLTTHAHEHPRSGTPAADIDLSKTSYEHALSQLTDDEWSAWWAWIEPRRDKYGILEPPPAPFRPIGRVWIPNEMHTPNALSRAALVMLEHAWIDVHARVELNREALEKAVNL